MSTVKEQGARRGMKVVNLPDHNLARRLRGQPTRNPFVPRANTVPRFGPRPAYSPIPRNVPRFGPRILPIVAGGLLLADYADHLLEGPKSGYNPPRFPFPASHYWHRHGPNTYNIPYVIGPLELGNLIYQSTPYGSETGKITAQAITTRLPMGSQIPNTWNDVGVWKRRDDGVARFAQVHAFEYVGPGINPAIRQALDWPVQSIPQIDPNLLRNSGPPLVDVVPMGNVRALDPSVAPPIRTLAEELLDPVPDALPPDVKIGWRAIEIISGSTPQPYVRPLPEFARTPPEPGSADRKNMTRAKRAAVALFNGLDSLSELSEIVGEIYKALPKKIRAKYDKLHKQDGAYRRTTDQAGQYGIDGADWKLRAIVENWRLLDTNQAWKNIAKNLVEDQIHGLKNRFLPRNFGQATKEGNKAFGKGVNEGLDWLFP